MMNVPKNLLVVESDDTCYITLSHRDGNITSLVIVGLALPFLITSIVLGVQRSPYVFLWFVFFLLSTYYVVYLWNDRSLFIIKKESVQVLEGMHERKRVDVPVRDITGTYIVEVKGKTRTSKSQFYNVSKSPDMHELYVQMPGKDQLITRYASAKETAFIKNCIDEKRGLI